MYGRGALDVTPSRTSPWKCRAALHGPRGREMANLSSRGMSSANSESKVIALGRFHGYEFAALSGEEHGDRWGPSRRDLRQIVSVYSSGAIHRLKINELCAVPVSGEMKRECLALPASARVPAASGVSTMSSERLTNDLPGTN